MFVAFAALAISASGPLLGGRARRLGELRLRRAWLIVAALAVQVLITDVIPDGPVGLDVALHLATYVAAAVALWANRRLPGLLVLAAGAASNGITIALNHGTLPASRSALVAAGEAVGGPGFANSGVLRHPVLPWLGDVAATPAWLPFRNVISIGDVAILLGCAVLVHATTRSWLWVGWRRLTGRPADRGVAVAPVAAAP